MRITNLHRNPLILATLAASSIFLAACGTSDDPAVGDVQQEPDGSMSESDEMMEDDGSMSEDDGMMEDAEHEGDTMSEDDGMMEDGDGMSEEDSMSEGNSMSDGS